MDARHRIINQDQMRSVRRTRKRFFAPDAALGVASHLASDGLMDAVAIGQCLGMFRNGFSRIGSARHCGRWPGNGGGDTNGTEFIGSACYYFLCWQRGSGSEHNKNERWLELHSYSLERIGLRGQKTNRARHAVLADQKFGTDALRMWAQRRGYAKLNQSRGGQIETNHNALFERHAAFGIRQSDEAPFGSRGGPGRIPQLGRD